MIELRKITLLDEEMKECIALTVPEKRKDYVGTNAIALAYTFENNRRNIRPRESLAIYADGKMVGLITYVYFANSPVYKEICYRILPIMIDKDYVGLGYEKAAVTILLDKIRMKPFGEAAAVFAVYHPDENDMAELFESLSFAKTDLDWAPIGDDECKDIIARLAI
ncbi:MAG: hypothetical protein FWC77_00435 [Defluviitaleaceae bacterium]|nr:hypothetical protein [Defluviitaleaceae bacterium]